MVLEINSNPSCVPPLKWTLVTVAVVATAVAAVAAVAIFAPPVAAFLGLTALTLYAVLGGSVMLAVLSASAAIFLSSRKSKNPEHLNLNADAIRHISNFLPIEDVYRLGRVCKKTKDALSDKYLTLAKEFGYKGNDLEEAKAHLKILFSSIQYEIKSGECRGMWFPFPKDLIIYKKNGFLSFSVDLINTLHSFKSASTQQILNFAIFLDNKKMLNNSFILFFNKMLEGRTPIEKRCNYGYDLTELYHKALQNCNWETVQFYQQFIQERNPSAFAYVNQEGAQFLLNNGWSVNSVDSQGATPLHYALSQEVAVLLIAKGANPHVIDSDGNTPLHHFIKSRYYRWREDGNTVFNYIEYLFKLGMEPDDANRLQETPLSLMTGSANIQVIDLLKRRFRIKILSDVFNRYPDLHSEERERILEGRWIAAGI